MFDKRVRIFVIASSAVLLMCVLRLAQMQLLPDSSLQEEIARIKSQYRSSRHFKTIRGRILDRNGNVLATDAPQFQLCVNYQLCSILDENVREAALMKAAAKSERNPSGTALSDKQKELDAKIEEIQQILDKCAQFGGDREDIEAGIRIRNERIWRTRTFLAWYRNEPDPIILDQYAGRIDEIPFSLAISDFEKRYPLRQERLPLIAQVADIPEMKKYVPVLELRTDDDFFNAQVAFIDIEGVRIQPEAHRYYPYGAVAAQTIGWVGPARPEESERLFPNDKLSSYLDGEVCGKEDGVEYVCERVLRGKRGEAVYDIDNQLERRSETQFGKDVRLTLDISLQERIEQYLTDYEHDPNCGPGMAAVVIEVKSGDVLALVSLPAYDLNRARYDYGELAATRRVNGRILAPLVNRAINQLYPPGSVVKPLIFIAGNETGVVTAGEPISCPAQNAPEGWPNCWIFNQFRIGHDNQWPDNNARNAIRGSCNIYFSRVAARVEPVALQRWLFRFGYGRSIVPAPPCLQGTEFDRDFRHFSGRISSGVPTGRIYRFEQVPPLSPRERRWFGIGHGKLLVTPLQVANAMAAIARGGVYRNPQIFLDDPNEPDLKMRVDPNEFELGMLDETLWVVHDGMSAVVNETNGKTFEPVLARLAREDVKVFGKTGSTANPDHAWFGGFARDSSNHSIAIAVVVEGAQSGARDAAPLGRDIIQFAIEAGYVGRATDAEEM